MGRPFFSSIVVQIVLCVLREHQVVKKVTFMLLAFISQDRKRDFIE